MKPTAWWGGHDLPEGEARRWRLGPLTLWVRHLPHEWRVFHRSDADPLAGSLEVAAPLDQDEPPPDASLVRYGFEAPPDRIELEPALADRPVVTRPEVPFYLLPDEEVTLYITHPVWVRLLAADPPRLLLDLPTLRLSDTWFGPSTRQGELCYFSRTSGRLQLGEVALVPGRALTAVVVRNKARDAFLLERMSLPAPLLSLYAGPAGRLWTDEVTVERQSGGELAAVMLGGGPPPAAAGAERIAAPRQRTNVNVLMRAFSALVH